MSRALSDSRGCHLSTRCTFQQLGGKRSPAFKCLIWGSKRGIRMSVWVRSLWFSSWFCQVALPRVAQFTELTNRAQR